jgi:hypothetical protein
LTVTSASSYLDGVSAKTAVRNDSETTTVRTSLKEVDIHGTPEAALEQAVDRMAGLVVARKAGAPVHWSLMLAHLHAYQSQWLPLALDRAVVEARAEGASWNDIGSRLGMTKQAAQSLGWVWSVLLGVAVGLSLTWSYLRRRAEHEAARYSAADRG